MPFAEVLEMSQLDLFEERAAIKEFDGGMSRKEAEKQAREETSLTIKADDVAAYRELGWSTAKAIRMEAMKYD